uniref:Carboxylic ester hydrolase n=1 Tax=Anoplophora glabripennis TaxID=217634 RepID=A0A8F8MZ75_ANOGL|nr:carboxylesterase [Anoplophora glabripennis]QYA72001.1 carboxylesterase [Anoplophora glabripennis]
MSSMNNIAIFTLTVYSVVLTRGDPLVELPLGKIVGSIKESVSGRKFYSFEGVPYAKPPVGTNRFEAPLPIDPWNGTWTANVIYKCLQYRHLSQSKEDPVTGLEDCLYLNIYTPSLDVRENLDVIVFIHGGAFMFNYGAFQGPQILLDKDIVYVNLNYRLGPLGFLSTEDDVVPGNNGIKDQIVALQFIQKYIRYFGGNPNSVTITGNSAGGGSVHFHYMISKSKGLFHKGFSQSGTTLNPWVIAENPLEKTKQIASLLGCSSQSTKEMVDCLKERPGKQIVETITTFQPWLFNPFSPFAVVVDKWAEDPLIPDHPYQLLKKKLVHSVPWIASHVNSEGLYPAAEFFSDEKYLDDIDKRWDDILPHILHYNETVNSEDIHAVNTKIRDYYLGDANVNKHTFGDLVQIIGDRLFVTDIHKAVKLHAEASAAPTYLYYFTYRGEHSRSEGRSKSRKNFGAAHGDDASYILSMALDTRSNERDKAMSDMMVEMWLSVARTGKPNVTQLEWTPVPRDSKRIKYLRISSPDNLLIEENENLGNKEFWESLPIRENEKLFERTRDKNEL